MAGIKLVWAEQATVDLENIAEYIARNSIQYAKITVKNIRAKTGLLKENPYLGRVVPEAGIAEIRELIYGNYRIIYHISSSSLIQILSIYHSARMLQPDKIPLNNE